MSGTEEAGHQPTTSEAPTLSKGPLVRVRTLGEGMTGKVEEAVYIPLDNLHPVGLGTWIHQRADMEVEFPAAGAGRWVRQPESMTFAVLKLPVDRRDLTNIHTHLTQERAVLLRLNNLFIDDAVARPPRLFGYGVRRRTGEAYLVLEDIVKFDNNFKTLSEYSGQQGSLSEQEALEIAVRLAFILKKAHQNDITHEDINDLKLDNAFWNPQNKHLRLIDWGNARFPQRDKSLGYPTSNFYYDRLGLGSVLFKLITGRNYSGKVTPEDWQKMSQPTINVLGKILGLGKDNYRGEVSEDTEQMRADLSEALKAVSGRVA